MQTELPEARNQAQTVEAGEASPPALVVAISDREATLAQRRRVLSAFGVFIACVVWYLMLEKLQASREGLPWYVTSAAIALLCAYSVAKPRREKFFFRAVHREPLSLLETWSIAYFIAAISLYAWVVLHEWLPPPVVPKSVQIVDIQLTSPKDFADRDSAIAGTQVQEELHKRQSDSVTSQGALAAAKDSAVARKSEDAPKSRTQPENRKEPTDQPAQENKPQNQGPRALPVVKHVTTSPIAPSTTELANEVIIRQPPRASQPSRARTSTQESKAPQQPFIEEVQPPELVEMIENDGNANAHAVFQSGGSSDGGKGAANDLDTYIKELHKRIKHAWTPPRGLTRRAQILFRIKHDGKLAFVRLTRSSGDSETDEAALKAIMTSVREQLPSTYSLPYIDVQYNFNYTADELKEVAR